MKLSKIIRSLTLIAMCFCLTALSLPQAHAATVPEGGYPTNSVTVYDLTDGIELDASEVLQLKIDHSYEIRTYFNNNSTDVAMTSVYFRADKHIFFAFDQNATQSYNGAFYANGLVTTAHNLKVQAPDSAIWVHTSFMLHYKSESCQVPEGRVISNLGAPLFVGTEESTDTQAGGLIAPNSSGYVALRLEVCTAPVNTHQDSEANAQNNTQSTSPNHQKGSSSIDDHEPTNAIPDSYVDVPHQDDEPRAHTRQIVSSTPHGSAQNSSKSDSNCEDAVIITVFLTLLILFVCSLFKSNGTSKD